MNKHLKLIQRNYVGYTGQIGRWGFVDGISVEAIPAIERIRIAANFNVVELDADGNEDGNPSPSHIVVENHRTRLTLRDPLPRQTEEDKKDENVRAVMGAEKPKPLLSQEALDLVASESGIAGLREVAKIWDVRSKSIPVLIQMILDAQKAYADATRETLVKKGAPAEEIDRLLSYSNEPLKQKVNFTAEKTTSTPSEVLNAARDGDLSAAINLTEMPVSE